MGKVFVELKIKLTKNPVLSSPNFEKVFIIKTDALRKGIGAVMTERIDKEEHSII